MEIEKFPILKVPTEPFELASLLNEHANDWKAVLYFFEMYGKRSNIEINVEYITYLMEQINE